MLTPSVVTPSRIFSASPRLPSRPSNKSPSMMARSTVPRGCSPPSSQPCCLTTTTMPPREPYTPTPSATTLKTPTPPPPLDLHDEHRI
ncbi:hypothetical protein D0Y65_034241 [Glycine soja]|uniref:Uncharacterized protein n=1 Tax=Glycine soja TaxID=3848 RepID=A0A445HQG8_GLYSO|nr:hypothetical protein D0Y65_034241 [Glycine soja]